MTGVAANVVTIAKPVEALMLLENVPSALLVLNDVAAA